MPTAEYAGRTVEVNEEGFFVDASQWDRDVGQALASEIGMDLNDKHWQVIDFCRSDFETQGQAPGPRRISKMSGVNMKELYQLFPKGPGKLVAKVAGLPKPKSCI
jgi:tRNA 2-thiouridine synthesizing protein E